MAENPAMFGSSFFVEVALDRYAYNGIFMHMRTTINIDDDLLARAAELTGIKEKTTLVRMALECLIARESAKRLARLGGLRRTSSPSPGAKATGER